MLSGRPIVSYILHFSVSVLPVLCMNIGYLLILLSATFWGASGVIAKYLSRYGVADALLMSQSRVTFAFVMLLAGLCVYNRKQLRVRPSDIWRFALLGLIGFAASNFTLYYAIERMDTAIADVIQFSAPVMVALYMWWRGIETLDRAKIISLVMSTTGVALALGIFKEGHYINLNGFVSAVLAAFSLAFIIIWGKMLSRTYAWQTYLLYGFFGAAIFWMFIRPPWIFFPLVSSPKTLLILAGFSIYSALLPYSLFFMGLKRISASRAGILSTWEPVVIMILAWIVMRERLDFLQVAGILSVIGAIVIIELTPRMNGENGADQKEPASLSESNISS